MVINSNKQNNPNLLILLVFNHFQFTHSYPLSRLQFLSWPFPTIEAFFLHVFGRCSSSLDYFAFTWEGEKAWRWWIVQKWEIFKQLQQNKVNHTMPPKVDPNEVRFINIKVFGGEAGPAATLAPKLGPLGLNAKKVGEDIVKEGGKWKGIRVMVQLKCQNRAAEITVQPTSSALIIKELGGYERDRKKTKNVTHKGNLTLEQVKKIAKAIQEKSLAKNLAGTVKSVLGTCLSVGCTVDKLNPKQVVAKINNGELKI